jgi:hypothetical protein
MSVERTAEAAIESKKNYVVGLDRIDLGDLIAIGDIGCILVLY